MGLLRDGRTTAKSGSTGWYLALLTAIVLLLGGWPAQITASDHADPVNLKGPETNITDLFFFPEGDRLILIFNVRRALSSPPPYDLSPYTYEVNIDLTTPVGFTNASELARYGGTVLEPAKLHPDASIRIRLNDDASLKSIEYDKLKDTDQIRTHFAVRDDPFNFPRFYGVNAITMVMSIPRTAFPAGQQDFILWGTTARKGEQIDHVGRSIRTQLPRFGFLNTLKPSEHVPALIHQSELRSNVYNFLKGNTEWWSAAFAELMESTFLLRSYDNQPDVMIYTDRRPVGYPNGRLLTDDVVAQSCAFGDCLLQEISFIEGAFPRQTTNDKPFLTEFPYLAEPWDIKAPPTPPSRSLTPYLIGIAVLLIVLSWGLVQAIRWGWHHLWLWLRHAYFRWAAS